MKKKILSILKSEDDPRICLSNRLYTCPLLPSHLKSNYRQLISNFKLITIPELNFKFTKAQNTEVFVHLMINLQSNRFVMLIHATTILIPCKCYA